MKLGIYLLIGSVIMLGVVGCAENQTRIGEGTAIGGILGAAAGGIIGHQTHSDGAGVLIGGAIGAAGGAAVGAQIPKEHQDTYARPNSASVSNNQITMQQVVNLTKQGIPSDEIIGRIHGSRSVYSLTADDINYLKNQGVSQRVIEAMQASN